MISQKLFQLEKEIAEFLLNKLEHEEMTLERAAEISKYILQALPDNLTDKQIDSILPKLDDQFIELSVIVNEHLRQKQDMGKQAQINEAEKLIHEGRLNEAIKLMNNYIQQKIS